VHARSIARGAGARSPVAAIPAFAAARWISAAGGALGGGIGALYLLLWLLGVPPRWAAQGSITMKSNMALAEVLAGAALLLLGAGRVTPARRVLAVAASASVLLVGALTLAEYVVHVDLGIDQLIATEPLDVVHTVAPNRMGPPGATSLALLGAGLLALALRRRGYTALAAASCCVVLVPAVGFVYGVAPLYGAARTTIIAWPTVVALLALGFGLALADPQDGRVPVPWRDDAGGALLRRLGAPIALLPIALGYVRILGERQGLYGRFVGTGLFAVSLSVMSFVLLWRSAVAASASAAERRRVEEDARWRAGLLDVAHDAIFVWSPDAGIESWNRGAEELYGYAAGEAIGRVPHDLLATAFPCAWSEIEAALARSGHWEGELVHRTRSGAQVVVSTKLQHVRGGDGRVRVLESNRDVTAAKRVADELRRTGDASRARAAELEAILGCVADGVLVYDVDGRIMRSNAAADALLGYSARERLSPLADRLDGGRYQWLAEDGAPLGAADWPAVRAARLGETQRGTVIRMRSDGVERWLSVSAAPLVVDGARAGAVVSLSDTSERKRAEEQLRDADRRKSEFLAVLSHELRNPLAPIRNALHLLQHAHGDAERAGRATAIVERQVGQLTRLVEDLLDVTRISRGKIQLRRTRFDVAALVRDVVEDHRPVFASREIALTFRSVDRRLWIDGDPTRIRQLVGNLLHNAAKFTNPHGRVVVTTDEAAGSRAVIRVADDGVGIAPDMLARVFDPFAQADQSLHRTLGGLGLGLALVKGLVEMHDGTVEAHSRGVGQGSEFVVAFPRVEEAAAAPQPAPRVDGRSRPLHVLVIEDNLDAAETLKEGLEMGGHEVALAHDGVQGVEKARALRPDVVLCDIGLPGADGYEVARRLRAEPRAPRLVALTGYASPEDQRRAFRAGFDYHLAKPFRFEELERVLASAMTRPAARRILVVDDSDALRANVREILEDEGWEVHEARDASEAVRALEEFRPAVILLDYRLPDADGGDVLRTLEPVSAAPPVVLMTASTHVRELAMEHGLRFYVPKPFHGDELIDTVEHARAGA
jgi:PAS domain S-box-containing protein